MIDNLSTRWTDQNISEFVYIYYATYIVIKPNFTLLHCRPTIDAVLLLTTDVVVHHPRPSMTYSYLARVNRSSVCLYCLQYSGSFYFVYTPDSMLDIRWPTTPWSAYKLPEYVMQIPSDFRRWKTSGNGEHETRIYRENREVCVPKLPWSQKENVYPTSFAWNENSSTLLEWCAILWSVFFKKVEFKNNFVLLIISENIIGKILI